MALFRSLKTIGCAIVVLALVAGVPAIIVSAAMAIVP